MQRTWTSVLSIPGQPGTSVQNQWASLNGSPTSATTTDFNQLSAILQLPSQPNNNNSTPQLVLRQQLRFRRLQRLQQLQAFSTLNASPQYHYPSNLGMAQNSSISEPILNARQMQDLIMHAHVPVDELPSRGVPNDMITFIEGNREQLQHLAKMQDNGRASPRPGVNDATSEDVVYFI
jgi:hypothetical protein